MVTAQQPPLPPIELRRLVGPTDDGSYDNLRGSLVFPEISPHAYGNVFEFGCGCGQHARKLIQQHEPPRHYTGVDLHRGMIDWCRQHLTPYNEAFEFHHLDVHHSSFNPDSSAATAPFPVADQAVTLLIGWSVFPHLNQAAAELYLHEIGRVLDPGGMAITTWFLFDKTDFPMMMEHQNALFINDTDLTNAVIFDKRWLQKTAEQAGLVLKQIVAPDVRGGHWRVYLAAAKAGESHTPFPKDSAPRVIKPPPKRDRPDRTGQDRGP